MICPRVPRFALRESGVRTREQDPVCDCHGSSESEQLLRGMQTLSPSLPPSRSLSLSLSHCQVVSAARCRRPLTLEHRLARLLGQEAVAGQQPGANLRHHTILYICMYVYIYIHIHMYTHCIIIYIDL